MPITTEVIAGVLSILLLVETATGQTMPVTFSCDVRLLAMRFALKLQPERGSAGLAEVAAGLAVHPNGSACVGPPPTPPGPPGPPPPGPAPAPRPHVPFGQCSPPMGGVTLVHGRAKPCQPRPCSNPWRTTATVTACEELCKSNSSCQYGTWHDAKQGAYANACVLEGDNRYSPRREAGHTAFSCNHSGTLNDVPERLGHSIAWPPPPPRRLNRQLGRSRGWHLGVPSLTRTSDANTLYVDAAKGDDNSGAGTLRNQFRSILAALARATSLSAPRTIMLRAGTHFVNETLVLGPALSGTTITSYEHEEVVVSGGARLENLAWEKQPPPRHDGPTRSTWAPPAVDVYSARLADSLSFRELFNASNARLVPARTPNGNAELSPEEAHYTLRAAASPGMRDFGPVSAIVTNQSCAGCTDRFKGQFSYYSVGVGGPASNFVPPVSYWAQPHPHGGGATPYGIPAGVVHQAGTRGHPDDGLNLANATGGLVFMMQTHGWGSWVFDIASVAESGPNTTIMFGAGGFQEARGGAFPGSFYLSHRRELLDSPGEWYLDEAAGVLYLGVVVGSGPPISELFAGGSVNQLFRLQGSQEQPVCDVRISAITLRHSAPTYMSNHSVGSGGDYAVHRGGCITMRGTVNCTVDHSLFDGVGGNAVVLDGFNRHAHVRANEMRNIGENGVVLVGETEWVDGTAGDQPRLSVIEGNLIHHLGLYNKQACAVFSAVACQNTIENNIMFHGPRALFNMNDGFGGDTIARHNLFFKAVLETHDHGPYPMMTPRSGATMRARPHCHHLMDLDLTPQTCLSCQSVTCDSTLPLQDRTTRGIASRSSPRSRTGPKPSMPRTIIWRATCSSLAARSPLTRTTDRTC
jgi:hypothetical protein